MSSGNLFAALGAALQAGGRTFGVLSEDERQRKLQEQERQDRLHQQSVVNDRDQQDRQMRILQAAIENADPNQEASPEVYGLAKQFHQEGRFTDKPVAKDFTLPESGINIGEKINTLTNPVDHVGHFKRQSPKEELEDAHAAFYKSLSDPNDTTLGLTPDQKKRLLLTMQSGVNANEVMGPVAKPSAFGTVTPYGEGQDALAGLDKPTQDIVKAIATYRYKLPIGAAMKDPFYQDLLKRAVALNPAFDASQYDSRASLRKDFNSGKGAANIRSLNTVISHLGKLNDDATSLDNSSFKPYNAVSNFVIDQTGDPRVNNFGMSAQAVENELSTLFKGTGATDQEIKAWREKINSSASPEQLQGVVHSALELIAGRAQALQDQWTKGMGMPKDFSLLTGTSRGILDKLGASGKFIDPEDNDQLAGPQEEKKDTPVASGKPGMQATAPQAPHIQIPQLTEGFKPGVGGQAQAAAPKTITVAQVNAFARDLNKKPADVIRQLQAEGYTIGR